MFVVAINGENTALGFVSYDFSKLIFLIPNAMINKVGLHWQKNVENFHQNGHTMGWKQEEGKNADTQSDNNFGLFVKKKQQQNKQTNKQTKMDNLE